jgi:hypothetical protein
VLGVGVVTPLVRPGSLVVPDGERGDPGFEVLAGGEVAAAQAARGLLCLRDCRLPCQRRESDELGEESVGLLGEGRPGQVRLIDPQRQHADYGVRRSSATVAASLGEATPASMQRCTAAVVRVKRGLLERHADLALMHPDLESSS